MPSYDSRGALRTFIPLALLACLALVLIASSSEAREKSRSTHAVPALTRVAARVSLNPVGQRFTDTAIPITGYAWNQTRGRHKIVLQRVAVGGHHWRTVARKYIRNGRFSFRSQRSVRAGTVRFRVLVYTKGRVSSRSNRLRVQVIKTTPQPARIIQKQVVLGAAYCQQLYVPQNNQERVVDWVWSASRHQWAQHVGTWRTVSVTKLPATAADCVHLLDAVPANAALPDLRIKDLTKCTRGELDRTNGTCFKIVQTDDTYSDDFPSLWNKKLLKFPVITMNVNADPAFGGGAAEIIADRSGDDPNNWRAYQTFYDRSGNRLGSVVDPGVQFYFAGDGHNHWHVRDFDYYWLTNLDGTPVMVGDRTVAAEKHGYCMQDNKTYDPWFNADGTAPYPNVPRDDPAMPDSQKGAYWETTSCGKGLPNALTIVHGLSKGWGDTYPTSLPDQAIDITGVPDGTYVVHVHADAKGAVTESDDSNNEATVQITITGDTVTVDAATSTGGL